MLVPCFGSFTSRVTLRSSFQSDGTDDAPKLPPATATSTFKYATAFSRRSVAYSSAHSVDPINPYSSASQLHRKIERLGIHPCLRSSPNPRATSNIVDVPLFGSTAPKTQASL